MNPKITFVFKIIAGVAGLFAVLLLFVSLLTPKEIQPEELPQPSPEDLAHVKELRDQSYDKTNPPTTWVDVDYAKGKSAAWYPKGEAPVLQELVKEGKLPPVAERVGPEPLVLKGIDGIGNYGGTIYRLKDTGGARFEPIRLVRWSPFGYPIVPNLAKSFTVSPDHKTFTFKLRKGLRWSDGHPFTSADISFWWNKQEMNKTLRPAGPHVAFIHKGKPMRVVTPDPYTVRFEFDHPHGLFLELLASFAGHFMLQTPAHYMTKFHPDFGDKKLINDIMNEHNLVNERSVYGFAGRRVERPSLAPWIIHTEKATPPDVYIRNPYYFAVDEQGNQLPYVDRIVVNMVNPDMLAIAASQGAVTIQGRYIRVRDYTMLMSQRKEYGYDVYHWSCGDGADWGVSLNLNRTVEENKPDQADRAKALKDKRFRQALSIAINRKTIIDATLAGMAKPMQAGSSPLSPFFDEELAMKYAQYDPEKANQLLDETGLTDRDGDGYRKFPGGPPLLFDMNYCSFTGSGPIQFLIDDWRKVGIHVRMRQMDRNIFYSEKASGMHDMTVWGGHGSFFPLIDPRYLIPCNGESNYAIRYARWYTTGGLNPIPGGTVRGTKPPEDSPLLAGLKLYEELKSSTSDQKKRELFHRINEIGAESCHHLNIYTPLPQLGVVKDGFKNVPRKGIYSWDFLSPSNFAPETWYWEKDDTMASTFQAIKDDIVNITPLKPLASGIKVTSTGKTEKVTESNASAIIGGIIKWGCLLALVLLGILIVAKYPFAGKRIMIMVPTLLIISMVSFVVIELPPGDAITTKIREMTETGSVDLDEIRETQILFRVQEPMWKRYLWWMGFEWFTTFSAKDEGLLQGNMGRSMIDFQPVNTKVGDRILFTIAISLGTLLFTWAVAIPIGIYSAVKQYSLFDYVFTIGGFIGMCIPGFLLALLLMFAAESLFGLNVTGLFSPEYAAEAGWSWGKIADLLKHLWLPVLIQGVAGTAGMIRVMRANLLDELKKPYVVTARAKGVRPMKLLFKYPVRLALNPFVSGIGGIFPMLISGGAIVAIVMSLPTVGPMQLEAVMLQDMYLAGSMLMVLSTLSVLGTLFSDLMLLALDPRIRFQGGSK